MLRPYVCHIFCFMPLRTIWHKSSIFIWRLKVMIMPPEFADTDRDQNELDDALSFRVPMSVNTVRRYSACPDLFTYPLCPRCNLPMEREYQCFCDHCGQALDWTGFSKAVIVLAHSYLA